MFMTFCINAEGGDQHEVIADVQPVDLDDQEVQLGQVRRSADSATNRREAADFEVPSPAMTGRSPSGSRTARLSLRVDTLISIRFMAQRPSQFSACAAVQVGSGSSWPSKPRTRGRWTATLPPWKPILPLVRPQRWPTRPPPRLCGAPASRWASAHSICSMAPIPAARQKRSNELSTSCQAVARLGTSASDEVVVVPVMALLSFADSTPRA